VELDDRGLGTRHPHAEQLVEGALAGHAEDLGAEVDASQVLPQQPVASRAALARQREQVIARLLQENLHAHHVEDAALVLQRRDRDLPAAVQLAEQVLARHAHGVEEHLVELGLAGHLAERAHRDARALHVDEQARDALGAPGLGIGAAEEHAPVGVVPERRPDLLAGHLEVIAPEHRLRAQRGQIRARARLGEAEAPEVIGGQDARGEAPLLRLAAVGEDGRAGDADAEVADDLRDAAGVIKERHQSNWCS